MAASPTPPSRDGPVRPAPDQGAVQTVASWLARSPLRLFLPIFLLAIGLRLFYLSKLPVDAISPNTRWEQEAIAVSLAETGRFADPFALPTGATAHLPPVMPGILGLIYRLFGVTTTAGYVGWAFGFATDAAVYGLLPWAAARLGLGAPAGVLAGLAGVLMLRTGGHGEGLTAFLLCLILVACVRRWSVAREDPAGSRMGSVLLGLAFGLAFHVQPALLPVMLGCLAFELWWGRRRGKWARAGLVAAGALLACVPWGWRNYAVFHEVLFVRSNFGLELRIGNHDGADADIHVSEARKPLCHPRVQVEEARKIQEQGEVAYMRAAGKEAIEWIRTHPRAFLLLTTQRIVYFWFGPVGRSAFAVAASLVTLLALVGAWAALPRLSVPQRAALLLPLATFPLVYYIVAYMPRYRIPIDWILLLLAGAAIARALGWGRKVSPG